MARIAVQLGVCDGHLTSQILKQRRREIPLGRGRQDGDDQLAAHLRPSGRPPASPRARRLTICPRECPRGAPRRGHRRKASSLSTRARSRRSAQTSRLSGTKPAPMPWIGCGPGSPPDSTGEASGSTAIILIIGFPRLQHAADAGQRAAGADAADHRIDPAARVAPDLLGRRLDGGSRGSRGWRTAAA